MSGVPSREGQITNTPEIWFLSLYICEREKRKEELCGVCKDSFSNGVIGFG